MRIGETILDLKYLISAQRWRGGAGPEPSGWKAGDYIVMMVRGEPLRFNGADAELALRTLAALAEPAPPPEPGTPLDPGTVDQHDRPPGEESE